VVILSNFDWRLKSLGVECPEQLPLLLPRDYKDLSTPYLIKDANVGRSILTLANIIGLPAYNHKNKLLKFQFKDSKGLKVSASTFSNSYPLYLEILKKIDREERKVFLYGLLTKHQIWFNLTEVELIKSNELKTIKPIYPSKNKVITSQSVQNKIALHQKSNYEFQSTIDFIFTQYIGIDSSKDIISTLLKKIHQPETLLSGRDAQLQLKEIATNAAVNKLPKESVNTCSPINTSPEKLSELISNLPFMLTAEQLSIIQKIILTVSQGRKLNDIISGDVGTGKTICYAIPLALFASHGINTGVILPTQTLVEQVYKNLTSYFPTIAVNKIETNKKIPKATLENNGRINIGTSVVLNSDKYFNNKTDVWVVDEEQKFGTELKENPLVVSSHYIGATATCIPRTQQLVSLGGFNVHQLRKCHVKKEIVTSIHGPDNSAKLLTDIKKTLSNSHKVIIVYPVAEVAHGKVSATARHNSEVTSVEAAATLWAKAFPNNVTFLHGKMKPEQKRIQLNEFSSGDKNIIISTTAIEVGFDDPNVYRVVIVHPEVHGLSGLHQMRGRVARNGGIGYCDLFAPVKLNEKSLTRLNNLCTESDGFKLAELDLKERGFGDLNKQGKKQSGDMDTFIVNHKVLYEDVNELSAVNNRHKKKESPPFYVLPSI
jgi:ATP-dependent DNA helicase RecG